MELFQWGKILMDFVIEAKIFHPLQILKSFIIHGDTKENTGVNYKFYMLYGLILISWHEPFICYKSL